MPVHCLLMLFGIKLLVWGAGKAKGLNPPFFSPEQLSSPAESPDGVQPREHAWRYCESAASTPLGDFERASWTPTHTACRAHSTEALTESDPLLQDISYQLGRQLLCLHPQTDSSPPPAVIKKAGWKLAGQLTTTLHLILGETEQWGWSWGKG